MATPPKATDDKRSAATGRFVVGRAAYKKVAEVEGLVVSRDLEADFRKFDAEGAPPSARRKVLAEKYAKKPA